MKVFFHLNSTNVILQDHEVYTKDEDSNLYITSTLEKAEMHTELMDGRLSDYFYQDYPSKRVAFSCVSKQETETVFFVAVPFKKQGAECPHVGVKEENGVLSIALNDIQYRVSFENGFFTML